MPRRTHPEDGRVFACPECDDAGVVYERVHRHKDFDHTYRCDSCGAEFDDPVDRESQHSTPATGGGAVEDDDGLPVSLNDDARELIKSIRGP